MPLQKYYAYHFKRFICSAMLFILYWKLKTPFFASKLSVVTVDWKRGEFLKGKKNYESFLGILGQKTSSEDSIISIGIEGCFVLFDNVLSKHWLPSLKKKKSTAEVSAKTTESCQESTRWQLTCPDETEKLKQHVTGNTRKRKTF